MPIPSQKTKKTVILGVTSGIAAYKSLELIKLLQNEDFQVHVIMTKSAQQMVSKKEFEEVSGNKVHTELFEDAFDYKDILKTRKVDHIDLADKADVFVIAPATANAIAKLAHGIADDFLTTTVLATTAPIIVCPSMNVHMWENPVTQENISTLRKREFIIVDPEKGPLACGYEGQGRLATLTHIKDEVVRLLKQSKRLQGKKILITAGGTQEPIDGVRSITNRSSGKMGIALAEECYLQGADVILLRATNSVAPRYLMQEELFQTVGDLFELLKKYVVSSDIIFHTAAVSDFQVEQPTIGKIPSSQKIQISLIPQIKLIDHIKKLNPKIHLIGFKAEYGLREEELIQSAFKKLQITNADAIVANDISKQQSGFESDMNEVSIIFPDKTVKKIPHASKKEIANEIVSLLQTSLLSKRSRRSNP